MAIGTAAAILGSAAIGGIVSSRGASKAASAQLNASDKATAAQLKMAEQARADQLTGVTRANDLLMGGQTNALTELYRGKTYAAEKLKTGYGAASDKLSNGYGMAETRVRRGMENASGDINDAYNTQQGLYQPTIDSGLAASGARDYTLGIGARPAGYQGFDQSEYFQSQLRNGQQAVDQSAAAGGNMFSGATLKALQQTGSDLAYRTQGEYLGNLNSVSSQGQNAAGNLAGAAGVRGQSLAGIETNGRNALAGMAIDRGQQMGSLAVNRGNALANLNSNYFGDKANIYTGTAGAQANAWAGLGSNLSNISLASGDAMAQGAYGVGNAQAAGAIGQANAFNGAIQNALGGWQYSQQAKQAATPYGQTGMGGYSGGLY